MLDTNTVRIAYERGEKPREIARRFNVTARHIQRMVKPYARPPKDGKAKYNMIENLRPYILYLMRQEGRDFTKCELCPATIPEGKYEIHHTKYEGATYYDLRIVCRRCNKAPINVGLI